MACLMYHVIASIPHYPGKFQECAQWFYSGGFRSQQIERSLSLLIKTVGPHLRRGDL